MAPWRFVDMAKVIDCHSHAWRHWPYEPAVPDSQTRGRAEQLLWEMDRHGVDVAILVAAAIGENADNNAYCAEMVRQYPGRLLHFLDLDSRWSQTSLQPGGPQRLSEALELFSPAGLSHYLPEENTGWLRSDAARDFYAAAAGHGLLIAINMRPEWLDDFQTLAAELAQAVFLVGHMGLSGLASTMTPEEASRKVEGLAEYANVHLKVSGFYYGAPDPWDYPSYPARDRFRTYLDAFGADRLHWGSDYPVAPLRAHSYRQSIDLVRRHCKDLDQAAQSRIFGGSIAALLGLNTMGYPTE